MSFKSEGVGTLGIGMTVFIFQMSGQDLLIKEFLKIKARGIESFLAQDFTMFLGTYISPSTLLFGILNLQSQNSFWAFVTSLGKSSSQQEIGTSASERAEF